MITVLYSCKRCGLADVEVRVPARKAPGVDVCEWVRQMVFPRLAASHAILAPVCTTTTLQDLKIPIDAKDPDPWVGKQTDVVPPRGDPRADAPVAP